ncbi:MAG TPA: hypothetical protein VMX57_08080 [Planctomycetota bacterium]|nr:hypothetical protein [Planctomycetota bacterium]
MRHVVTSVLVFIAAASAVVPARADLTPDETQKARALVVKLSDRRFEDRQDAVEKLIAMGPGVIPLIQETLDASNDAEVKLRCGMVLKGLTGKHGTAAAAALLAMRKFGTDASRVTLNETDAPLEEVLRAFAGQTGNRMLTPHRQLADRTVTFRVNDLPYWRALDALCESVGMTYDTSDPAQSLVLRKAAGERDLVAYTGPVVVKVTRVHRSVSTTRNFRVKDADRTARSLTLSVFFMVEDRLPLAESKVTFTKVTSPAEPDVKLGLPAGGTQSYGYGTGPHIGGGYINLTGDAAAVTGPLHIEGAVELELVNATGTLRIDDVLAGGEKRVEADATSIVLKRASLADGKIELRMNVRTADKLRQRLIDRRSGDYGLRLVDPRGDTHDMVSGFSRNGSPDGETGAEITMTFTRLAQVEGTWSLVFVYPTKTETKRCPFRIENIPLP